MANIAYGEITILDLLDDATYIYYAKSYDEENGASGITTTPSAESIYIGVYNGEQYGTATPEPNSENFNKIKDKIVWSNYAVKVKEVEIAYAINTDPSKPPDSGWQTLQTGGALPATEKAGQCLWTKTTVIYTNNITSTSYSVSVHGQDGDKYLIETNVEEVLRFYENGGVKFSPDTVRFSVFEFPDTQNAILFYEEDNEANTRKASFAVQVFYNSEFHTVDYYYGDNLYEQYEWPVGASKIGDVYEYTEEGYDLTSDETAVEGKTYYRKKSCFITLEKFGGDAEGARAVIFHLADWYKALPPGTFPTSAGMDSVVSELNETLYIRILYYEDDKVVAIKPLEINTGTDGNSAKLAINAADISAAINSAQLKFDANGLHITNGGFDIVKKTQKEGEEEKTVQLLYLDNEGNLQIAGDSYFGGALTAASGTFKGELVGASGTFEGELKSAYGTFTGAITAGEGSIGGFIIGETQLTSTHLEKVEYNVLDVQEDEALSGKVYIFEDGNYAITTDETAKADVTYYERIEYPSIILDGSGGRIEAQNLILGTGATIKDYINIGNNVKLYGSSNSEGNFIEVGADYVLVEQENLIKGQIYYYKESISVGDTTSEQWQAIEYSSENFDSTKNYYKKTSLISFGSNGILDIGSKIFINGQNSTISSVEYNSSGGGNGWIIKPDEAIFNNATIRGKISAAIFEQGKVSAVGGILIVRPTSKIKSATFVESEIDSSGEKTGDIWQIALEDSTGFDNSADLLVDNEEDKSQSFFITTVAHPNGFYGEANIYEEPTLTAESEETQTYSEILFNVKFTADSGEITEEDLLSGFVINYGSTGSVGLGLNGSTNGAAITPSSFSVFEWNKNQDSGKGSFNNRVILGDLSKAGVNDLSSDSAFGLYAENAYLKGSLTTDVSFTKGINAYAGINTMLRDDIAYSSTEYFIPVYSEVAAGELENEIPNNLGLYEKDGEEYTLTQDTSATAGKIYYRRSGGSAPIVFWAGANGTGAADIADSNFYVDRNGNIFANSGYFSGTIITNATITASKISTVEIVGGPGTDNKENSDQKALVIRDDKALEIRDSTNELVMTVEKGAVTLEKGVIFKIGDQTFGESKTSSASILVGAEGHSNSIYLSLPKYENSENKDYAMIHFGTNGITNDGLQNGYDYKFGITGNTTTTYGANADLVISTNEDRLAYFSKTENIGFEKTVTIKENLIYGSKNMEYRQVKDSNGAVLGYDLYIQ